MTANEAIELARAYVALSNAHRSDLIRAMFSAQAVYRSSAVGEHRGRDAIVAMMRDFFSRYADVNWQCTGYRCRGNRVSFEFALTASDTPDGEPLRRSGVEHIDFDAEGLIAALEVHGK